MRTLTRPMFNMGGPIKQGIMHGIREPFVKGKIASGIFSKVGRLLGGDKGWWSKIRPTGKFRRTTRFEEPGPAMKGDYTSIQQAVGYPGPKKTAWEIAKSPSLMWKGIKENPYWAGAAGIYGGPAAGALGVGIAKGPVWSGIKQAADLAVPDWLYDQDKHLAEIAARKKEKEEPIVSKYLEGKGKIDKKLTKAQKEKWADVQRGKRLNNLLDIMGYDRSKKTAVADALIDASKIVSDRGTLEKKNITRDLINPIIQATSKRFDKPEQIREAVGLMSVKAAIEKDLEDPTIKALRMKQLEKLTGGFEKDLGELLLAAKGTKVPKQTLEQFARLLADKHGDPFTVIEDVTAIPEGGSGIYMSGSNIYRVTDGNAQQIA